MLGRLGTEVYAHGDMSLKAQGTVCGRLRLLQFLQSGISDMETGGNEEIVAFPGKGKAALGIGHDHYPVVCHDEACGFLCYAHMNQQHFPHAVHPVLCGHQGNKGKQLPVLFAYKIFEGCCINLRRLPFLQVGTSDRHAVTGGVTREGRVYAVLLYLLLCRRLEKILYGRILEDLQPRVDIRAGGRGRKK